MKWLDAIVYVLQKNIENGEDAPMRYTDIADAIMENSLRDSYGASPQNTVNVILRANTSLFNNVGLGLYSLTDEGKKYKPKTKTKPSIDDTLQNEEDVIVVDDKLKNELEKEYQSKIIKVFGMFWDRSKVNWSKGKLLGQQNSQSDPIEFNEVRGLYLLYDGREVVYAGQALEQPIIKRLKDHTKDRMSGRWNRFSWFGIDGVSPDGTITTVNDTITVNVGDLINAFEGLLIEGLEPRQNRKQGNKFGDEYIQANDSDMQQERAKIEIIKGLLTH